MHLSPHIALTAPIRLIPYDCVSTGPRLHCWQPSRVLVNRNPHSRVAGICSEWSAADACASRRVHQMGVERASSDAQNGDLGNLAAIRVTQTFPIRHKLPASFHAIGALLVHTEMVRPGERMRCVIVDDNRDFLDAAARLLEHQGISVVAVATSSAEGLQRVEDLRPDVTLVDIDLGEESGFDVVEQLHRNRSGAAVRTILISTHSEEDLAELVAASPALAFIPKAALSGAAIRGALRLAG
jgi:CheY-like chemotaxis protein